MNNEQNKAWVKRDAEVIAPFQRMSYYPVAIKSGHGAILVDMDGNEYIDLLCSAGSQNVGHAHPKVIEAVHAQMNDYTQFTNAYFYNPISVRLAERLTEITPGTFKKKVAFGLSGSDGIDGAIKLARAYTGRNKIISFEGAYHGSTFGAISVSFVSQNMRKKIGSLLPDTYAFQFPNPYLGGEDCGKQTLDAIRRAFDSWLPPSEVAAVTIESLQGDGGLVVPPKDFFRELFALCHEHGILIIDDEIQQGCMRTGKWFGIEHFGVEPDILVMGKSAGGGMPLSAIIGRAEIMDCLAPPAHLFTMGGNAACCAAALAALDVMQEPGFQQGVIERSARMRRRFDEMAACHESIGDVRGEGFSIGVEIVSDKAAKTPDVKGAKKLCYRAYELGVLLICFAGNVLRVQPPLVITEQEIDKAMDILEQCVSELEQGLIPDSVADTVIGW